MSTDGAVTMLILALNAITATLACPDVKPELLTKIAALSLEMQDAVVEKAVRIMIDVMLDDRSEELLHTALPVLK